MPQIMGVGGGGGVAGFFGWYMSVCERKRDLTAKLEFDMYVN